MYTVVWYTYSNTGTVLYCISNMHNTFEKYDPEKLFPRDYLCSPSSIFSLVFMSSLKTLSDFLPGQNNLFPEFTFHCFSLGLFCGCYSITMVYTLVCNSFLNFRENAKFMRTCANFRVISRNFVLRKSLQSFREIFAKTKNFAKVFAKTKFITNFDGMVHSV
jgi:hypothetical protein